MTWVLRFVTNAYWVTITTQRQAHAKVRQRAHSLNTEGPSLLTYTFFIFLERLDTAQSLDVIVLSFEGFTMDAQTLAEQRSTELDFGETISNHYHFIQ